MAMNTNYHDRGMKKWQPFFSSPHLKASVLANREEVLATYQAPEVMTESEIDAQLQRAFQERLRVKVTLNADKTEATFEDNDGDTRVSVKIPTKHLDPSIVAVSVVPLKEKLAALGEDEHQAYEISFLNKDGKEVPVKGDAKVIFPVDKAVTKAYYLTSDTKEIVNEVPFEMMDDGRVALTVNHFSLYAVSFGKRQETPSQPANPSQQAGGPLVAQAAQLRPSEGKGQLPATGESDQTLLFSAAALSLLAGLGLVATRRPEDQA